MTKKAYKLVRLMADGTLSPLFIDKKLRYTLGQWFDAKEVPTKGFAFRPGFHTTAAPVAPHLKESEKRVWCEVTIDDFEEEHRPVCQGGTWYLSNRMCVDRVMGDMTALPWFSIIWIDGKAIWARGFTENGCHQVLSISLRKSGLADWQWSIHTLFEKCDEHNIPYMTPQVYSR